MLSKVFTLIVSSKVSYLNSVWNMVICCVDECLIQVHQEDQLAAVEQMLSVLRTQAFCLLLISHSNA